MKKLLGVITLLVALGVSILYAAPNSRNTYYADLNYVYKFPTKQCLPTDQAFHNSVYKHIRDGSPDLVVEYTIDYAPTKGSITSLILVKDNERKDDTYVFFMDTMETCLDLKNKKVFDKKD